MWTLKRTLPQGLRIVCGKPLHVPVRAMTTQTISAHNGQLPDPKRRVEGTTMQCIPSHHSRSNRFIVGLALCLTGIGLPLDAGLITTGDGDGADAMIRAGTHKESNLGNQTSMAVKDSFDVSLGPNFTRKAYFRFDLTTITGPVNDVSFNPTVVDFPPANNPIGVEHIFNVWALNDGVADEDWEELAITWINAPGNDINSGSNMVNSTFLGTFALFEPTTETGDVVQFSSAALLNAVNADTNNLLTLMLTDATQIESGFGFYTKEFSADLAPVLSFSETSAAVPEPSSLILLGTGALALIGCRARRRRRKQDGVSHAESEPPCGP